MNLNCIVCPSYITSQLYYRTIMDSTTFTWNRECPITRLDIPEGTLHVVFCDKFNSEITEDMFPDSVRSIQFGSGFHKNIPRLHVNIYEISDTYRGQVTDHQIKYVTVRKDSWNMQMNDVCLPTRLGFALPEPSSSTGFGCGINKNNYYLHPDICEKRCAKIRKNRLNVYMRSNYMAARPCDMRIMVQKRKRR